MADPLAEILNRINANPQSETVTSPQQPPWAMKALNAVLNVQKRSIETVPRIAASLLDAATLGPVRRDAVRATQEGDASFPESRTYAGQGARVVSDVVAGAVNFPNLPALLSDVVGGPKLPQSDMLGEAAEEIHKKGKSVGESIAGRSLNDSLLDGSTTDLGASWVRLIAGAAIPIPGSWQAKMASGLQKVSAGNATVDTIAAGATKALEILTPLTLNPKMVTPNIVVASAIGPALELAVANHEQAAASIKAGSEQVKGALDVAGQGATEVRDASAVRTVQAGMLPSVTGDDTTDAVIGASLLGAGVIAQMKFNIAGRALTGAKSAMSGVKAGLTGYDPTNAFDKTNVGFLDLLETQGGNRNLPMAVTLGKSLRERNTPDANAREVQFREMAAMRSGPSVTTRMETFVRDGQLPDSIIKVKAPSDHYAVRVTPEQEQLIDRTLLSIRELDTRRIHKVPFDLYNTPTRDLEAIVRAGRADPTVSALVDDYLATNRKLGKYMGDQARISRTEMNKFFAQNPNFVASNLKQRDGTQGRWINPRNVKANEGLETFEELGSPRQLWPQYWDEVIRSTEGKKVQREYLMEMRTAARNGDKTARDIIGRELDHPPPHNTEGYYVHWRDALGNSKWTEIKDAAVRHSLQDVTNPAALQMHKGLFDMWKRLPFTRVYETSAVGVPAAATGSQFATTSAKYTAQFGAAFRPKGIAASPLDKWMQDLTEHYTGKRVGIPGEVLSAVPHHIYNATNGIIAVLAQRGSMAIRNSLIRDGIVGKGLNAVLPQLPIGPNTAQAVADGMNTLYKKSIAAQLQNRGIMGPGTMMSVDPALSYKNAEQLLRSHGVIGKFKEAGTFVQDILHAITSAPAHTMHQLNKGRVHPDVLANAVRTMSGDPGASGAYRNAKWAAHLTNTIPWGNIMAQAGYKALRGFRENPKGAVGGIVNVAAIPTSMSVMWAAAAGPEYLDYLLNQRTPDRLASSIYIAIPGMDPEQGAEITMDPMLSPFIAMSALTTAANLGMLDGSIYRPENAPLRDAIVDLTMHRAHFGKDGVGRSVLGRAVIPPMPGPLQAGGAALGAPVRSFIEEARPRDNKHRGGFSEGEGPRPETYMNMYGPAHLEDIVRGLFTTMGVNILHMLDDTFTARFSGDMGRNEPNQGWKEAAQKGFISNFSQNARDSMKEATPLFDSFLAISPAKEASAVRIQEKLQGLRSVMEAYGSSTLPGGAPQTVTGNKKTGQMPYTGVAPIGARDEIIQRIGLEAGRIYREIGSLQQASIKQLHDDRSSIAQSNKFGPAEKRALMNERAMEIIERNRRLLADIERQESIISRNLGVPVKFDKLNLNKGSEQFK